MVTYEPDVSVTNRLFLASRVANKIVVVDNGSVVFDSNSLDRLPFVHVIHNTINKGLAAALNQGINVAASLGCCWVLTLDQDSVVKPQLVSIANKTFHR